MPSPDPLAAREAGEARSRDELVRTLSADRSVSVRVLAATNLVREAARRHQTSPTATVALGRALMGALLLATEGQDGERLQLRIRGDGPLGSILVTASSRGDVRGYAAHPAVDVPPRGRRFDVGAAVGPGTLFVERNHPSWKQPYGGIVPLVTGEIARDLAHYLLESEQKPSAVALGVQLGPDGGVEAAGGYLVQKLPDATDGALEVIERRVQALLRPSELLRRGASADGLVDRLLGGLGSDVVGRLEPRFSCPCSIDRVRSALVLLGADEIRDIIERRETLEVHCHFCAERYEVPPAELAPLLA
jgi:molecular chaperone Hsp33